MTRNINEFFYSRKPDYMQASPEKFKDNWYFDIGYQLAFVTVIWTIGIFFSAIAPIIPCICFVYFFFKYWIDKYNLMYVY
jgi:Calcium-dependent channel, 7TM region, putative phosphate